MRFASLVIDRRPAPVVIADDLQRFVEVRHLLPGFDGDMIDLIAQVPLPDQQFAAAVQRTDRWQAVDTHELLAPLEVRRNIFCVGKNYHEHAREFSQSGFDTSAQQGELAPPAPVVFTKPASTVVAHRATVKAFEHLTSQLDYEVELAVVIGKPGRGISKADALQHVWGYTIVNDFTARDLQQKHRQWFIGKSLDTFCPMGPYLVSAHGIDSANLNVRCWINDELRQNANTKDLIFDIPTIIETLSAGMTLLPGDVIATGTPAGVGIGFKPPRFLKKGDVMKLEIDHLGSLVNTIG
ncbi:fumarylacetoacetate hydrolase family protein [Paraburkholderia phytofirmans]|uniref:fumarylacetoacetate hydrolase family protein n=1 Tax=Paraburkholderia sp. BL9I2N2 TaxID=1938809 RepID=UPI00104FF6D4|nr:fumarylacetoacetate hydrolase family protein [Paraburkholderia sp. BL9I2N2]TCK91829.1 2-keto-4-pentenoate hydratase/2-oxohepta-3-ene-1,7-dioic acid hydratase in catechol pathway [Paraburkholderia sp. BL9I2N2]